MKTLLIIVFANYVGIGLAHALFVCALAKKPTPRLVAAEFLLWPRRTWQGVKAIRRDAGKLE